MVLLSRYSYEYNVPQGPTLPLISTIHVPYIKSRIKDRKRWEEGGGGGAEWRETTDRYRIHIVPLIKQLLLLKNLLKKQTVNKDNFFIPHCS